MCALLYGYCQLLVDVAVLVMKLQGRCCLTWRLTKAIRSFPSLKDRKRTLIGCHVTLLNLSYIGNSHPDLCDWHKIVRK